MEDIIKIQQGGTKLLSHTVFTLKEKSTTNITSVPTHGCGEATLSLPTDRREADFDGPPTQVTY